MFDTTANLLTWTRIALIPLFVLVFYIPWEWTRPLTAIVFSIAAITDWADGYLARKLGQSTPFGAFLDPVADKLMVATALVLLVRAAPQDFVTAAFTPDGLSGVVVICAIIIIGREIAISALREWMAEIGERNLVRVSGLGKWKTTFQITALIMMLFQYPLFGLPIYALGVLALVVASVLTIWSMFRYLRAAWPLLRDTA